MKDVMAPKKRNNSCQLAMVVMSILPMPYAMESAYQVGDAIPIVPPRLAELRQYTERSVCSYQTYRDGCSSRL